MINFGGKIHDVNTFYSIWSLTSLKWHQNDHFRLKNAYFHPKTVNNIFEIICILKAVKNYSSYFEDITFGFHQVLFQSSSPTVLPISPQLYKIRPISHNFKNVQTKLKIRLFWMLTIIFHFSVKFSIQLAFIKWIYSWRINIYLRH